MRTLLIDTDRLGPVHLREVPKRTEKDGTPEVNANGEAVLKGRLMLPGGARSLYADNAVPAEVRLKMVGSDRGLVEGAVVLGGRCTITTWFLKGRGREGEARSELTVSAERVEAAPAGARVVLRGWLPVRPMMNDPAAPLTVLDEVPLRDGGWRVFCSLPPGAGDGLAEVTSATSVESLVGEHVHVDLVAKLVTPAAGIDRSNRADFVLMGTNWRSAEPETRPSRPTRPTPAPSEGEAA